MNKFVFTFLVILHCCAVGLTQHGTNHRNSKRQSRATNNQTREEENCNSRVLFDRLEAHLDERLNGVRREIWTNARNIEQATKAVVGSMKRDVTPQSSDIEVERQLQVVIATLRLISSDLNELKSNISQIVNETEIKQNIKDVFSTEPVVQNEPSNCLEVLNTNNGAQSGVYLVSPKGGNESFMVYCDMDFQNGGWLTIHNRVTGEQDFYKNWEEYKMGFGNLVGEHWLGLEKIHQLTGKEINELAVELIDVNFAQTHAIYDVFSIGSEQEGYALKALGAYTGTAGDSMTYHAGSKFSTKDRDQDGWSEGNCAQSHGGAWWYKSCEKANLNGRYYPGDLPNFYMYQSMYWDSFGGPLKGLKYAKMMIRPKPKHH